MKEPDTLNSDLSLLTTIPLNALDKLTDKSVWAICHRVEESSLSKRDLTVVDIGIGKLYIKVEDESLHYKFVPSTYLENNLVKTIVDKKNPLKLEIEKTLASKFINTYKDFL